MRIVDHTGRLGGSEKEELLRFVSMDLLSAPLDRHWLDAIRYRDDHDATYLGYWAAKIRRSSACYSGDPGHITGLVAVIVLNGVFLRTLDEMKETLAHEYGHHWTLSYWAVESDAEYSGERIPKAYYKRRGLTLDSSRHDYSNGWNECDKEILAEDYRALFAPHPYDGNHAMIDRFGVPDASVERYIRSLRS